MISRKVDSEVEWWKRRNHWSKEFSFVGIPLFTRTSSCNKQNLSVRILIPVANSQQSNAIKPLYQKFKRTSSVTIDKAGTVARFWSAIIEKKMQVFGQTISPSSKKISPKTAAECQLSRTISYRISYECLAFIPQNNNNKINTPSISDTIHRNFFVNEILKRIRHDNIDVNSTWFSNETYFYVNKF